jgi:hypothetical protein
MAAQSSLKTWRLEIILSKKKIAYIVGVRPEYLSTNNFGKVHGDVCKLEYDILPVTLFVIYRSLHHTISDICMSEEKKNVTENEFQSY